MTEKSTHVCLWFKTRGVTTFSIEGRILSMFRYEGPHIDGHCSKTLCCLDFVDVSSVPHNFN